MAYRCESGQCDGNSGGSCSKIQYFSNPNSQYNNKAIGSIYHDNARQINNVRATVAAYYEVTVSLPTVMSLMSANLQAFMV